MDLVYLFAWVACVVICWSDSTRVPPAPAAAAPAPAPAPEIKFDAEDMRRKMREAMQTAILFGDCRCDLCCRLKEHPELVLGPAALRSVQESVVLVGTGRGQAGITSIDGLNNKGMLNLRIVCVAGEVYDTMLEPVLMREFGTGRDRE
jgi:hypothetical protein